MKRLSGKIPLEQNSSGKKIGAESAVPILVYLCIVLMVHKYRQSAKRIRSNNNILFEVFPLTIGSGKTMPFEKRRSRYKETAENKAEAYLVYVEHLFSACDAVDARIFSKGDGIDRVINTLLPDGSEQKNEYEIEDGLQITIATDPLENKSVTKKDARGNIREVERRDKADNILTKGRYEYSVLGEMLRAYDANENIVSVTYDLLGRKVALESKDSGRKEWRYDHKGLLEAESDSLLRSKLSEIQYHYDGFDRLIKIDYPFSTDVEYTYGQAGQAGAGEIVHKKDESGEIRYEYGKLSEVVKETRTIKRYEALSEPETATFTYRSDYLGRMQTMRYPDGEVITYTYDKGGQLKGVSGVKNTVKGTETYSYIDTIVYDEHGQRVYIKYGNGVETRYRYDDKRRWLKDIETKNKQTDEIFQKIRYSFDKVGNVLGYSNDASVYETSQSYTYDSLYQLIGVEGTSNQYKAIKSFGSTPVHVAKYKQDFAFDGIGNMTRKVSTTNIPGSRGNAYPNAELDYSLDYEYDPAYAHRLIHAGNRYYRYDANGNITAEKDGPFTEDDEFVFTYSYDPDTDVYGTDYGFGLDAPKETEETHPENLFAYRRNYTWNEKNLLTKSSDRSYTVHYRYGEDGQRALKYTEEGRSETLYFNNFYTIHIPVQDKNNPQGLRVHKHIFVGNSRLVTAMTHTDNNGDNAEQREKRYYYHSDHLGSAQFVTDWRGRQYEHIEYTPYGELWIEEVAAGLDKLPFRFTGKEMDEETGLYYYGARYLDPKYSRWLSGDPALGEYVSGTEKGEGGIYNGINFNLYHYANNNPVKYTDPNGEWAHIVVGAAIGAGVGAISAWASGASGREIVAAAVGGAVTGGMAAATCGMSLGATIAGSAMAGTAGYLAENIVAGKQATVEGTVMSGASGAASAMAGEIIDKAADMVSSTIAKTAKNVKTASPYSNITDDTNIGVGKNFTARQKQTILQANSNRNNGVIKSDSSGKVLTKPIKSQSGVTPRQDEWQIDHIIPKSKGGTNSYSNAQVLSRQENRLTWDN